MAESSNLSSTNAKQRLATHLRADFEQTLGRWRTRVESDAMIQKVSHLTRAQFYDHVPRILEAFAARLESDANHPTPSQTGAGDSETQMAFAHSQHRWQQGYDLTSLTREWCHLNACLLESIDEIETRENLARAAFVDARVAWAQIVTDNLSEGVAHYTELLQMEAQARLNDLESALEDVRVWERERGQVLHQASHDLRGSLSVVAGASSLLETPALQDSDRPRVAQMLRGGVRALSEMLGALLDMSRLEAGHEKREIAAFDVSLVLRVLGESALPLAQAKGLKLEIDGPRELFVDGDAGKIHRIAQNLLLNALKYTREGAVKLSWEQSEPRTWSLFVSDTGPGLERSGAAPLAAKLSDATNIAREVDAESSQNNQSRDGAPAANKSSSRRAPESDVLNNIPGEGIGLSIVRRLCELLGAALELDSSTSGSSFRVIFPAKYN